MEAQKTAELLTIAKMSEEDAKTSLLASVEKKYEEDILGRMKKLEDFGEEKFAPYLPYNAPYRFYSNSDDHPSDS